MATARQESGEGSVFGHKVSAYLMARLASKNSYADFCDAKVVQLTLQGSHLKVPFDDQVVTVDTGTVQRRHLLQCKINLNVQPSDETFQDVLGRAYVAIHNQDPNTKESDLFVLVCAECKKSELLRKLFAFASRSLDLQDLTPKLGPEGQDLVLMLSTVRDALERCLGTKRFEGIEHIKDDVFFELLKRMRIWMCDLNNEGSNDKRHAVAHLIPFCKQSEETARTLYRQFASSASREEMLRATSTWETLKSEFGVIEEPSAKSDSLSQNLTQESLSSLEARINELRTAMRFFSTFESYKELRAICESYYHFVPDALVEPSSEQERFLQIYGKAVRSISIALLKLRASDSVIRDWLSVCHVLADRYKPIWGAIGRFAAAMGDKKLYEESVANIVDTGEQKLVRALWSMHEKDYDAAKVILEKVQGESLADALLNLANITVEHDQSENGILRATEYVKRALSLHPEHVLIEVLGIQYVLSQYDLSTSNVYKPSFDAKKYDSSVLINASRRLEELSRYESIGAFEHILIAQAQIELGKIFATDSSRIKLSVDDAIEISRLQGPHERLCLAALLLHLGREDPASMIVEEILLETEPSCAEYSEAERMRKALGGDESLDTYLPSLEPGSQVEMSALRQGFYGSMVSSPEKAANILDLARSSNYECSFIHEIEFLSSVVEGDVAKAESEFEILKRNYEFAVGTWTQLLWWGLFRKKDQWEVGEREQGDDLMLPVFLRIAQHTCQLLPAEDNYVAWLELVAHEPKSATAEFELIAEMAAQTSNAWASAIARAIACNDRKDFRGAVESFNEAERQGPLSRHMKVLHDQAKWQSKLFEDLASQSEDLLANKNRHPRQALPTIYALKELNRDALAIHVAERNFNDFPDDRDAHSIFFQTCLDAGDHERGVPSMMEFTKLYPDDGRARMIKVDDEPGGIVGMMQDFREVQEKWIESYARCEVPLKLLEGVLASKYIEHSNLYSGIQVMRPGFGVTFASEIDFDRVIVVDYTTLLTITKFGLWNLVATADLKIVIPDFVFNEIKADERSLFINKDSRLEGRLDRIEAFLNIDTLVIARNVFDENDRRVFGETYENSDNILMRKHSLVPVDMKEGEHSLGVSLLSLLKRAKETGALTASNYNAIEYEFISHGYEQSLLKWEVDVPSKILLSGHVVEALSELSNPENVLRLFDKVYVGPSALFMLSMQFGKVRIDRSSRKLMAQLSEDIDNYIEKGYASVLQTQAGRIDDVEYFHQLVKTAVSTAGVVWVDDMWARRLLLAEAPQSQTVSTVEMLVLLAQAKKIDTREAESLVLELAANGHRDVLWNNAVSWANGTQVGSDNAKSLVRRLTWLVAFGHLNIHERKYYMDVLIRNALSALWISKEFFLEIIEVAGEGLHSDAGDFFAGLVAACQREGTQESFDLALTMAELAQSNGWFSIRKWCEEVRDVCVVCGAREISFHYLDERIEFSYWYGRGAKLMELFDSFRKKNNEAENVPT